MPSLSALRRPQCGRLRTTLVIAGIVGVAGLTAQTPGDRVDQLIAQMTLEEKISMLHGTNDPEPPGYFAYVAGVSRLGIPPLRITEGASGIRATDAGASMPTTALPAPIALAATFSPELGRTFGQILGRDARARRQHVVLAPMVDIARAPLAGRHFETLGEDPFLASRIAAAEVEGIQRAGAIAAIKHFAADGDERALNEIELPAFEGAVRAGAGAVVTGPNKINGTWASESVPLLTDILRGRWQFTGFVMSGSNATYSAGPAISAGTDLEIPQGRQFASLAAAVKGGQLGEATINRSVRRVLLTMDRAGLLNPAVANAQVSAIPVVSAAARDIAVAGAVLLKNARNALPLGKTAQDTVAIIGPTSKSVFLLGPGGVRAMARPMSRPYDAVRKWAPLVPLSYAVGYDLDGRVIPVSALTAAGGSAAPGLLRTDVAGTREPVVDHAIDFVGPDALPPNSSFRWTGTVTAPGTGEYMLALHIGGGLGDLTVEPAPASGTPASDARGRRPRYLKTEDGLAAITKTVQWTAGSKYAITVTGRGGPPAPMEIRLAWVVPDSSAARIDEAVRAAKAARTAVVFAFDRSEEGQDRPSLSLPGEQDALIQAVAAANPRTVVVLNTGGPILMPWAGQVAAILQMWYPGQEHHDAVASILTGDASPGGRLAVTFPRRAEDAPPAAERTPDIFAGYRWYDQQKIEPLFPFGHGLSYSEIDYSNFTVTPSGDGFDAKFTVRNKGLREASDVPQIYLGPPAPAPVPMAARALVGFQRVILPAGRAQDVTIHVGARELSYWSTGLRNWALAAGQRTVYLAASSRDMRGEEKITIPAR